MITNNKNHWPTTDIRYWEGKVAFQTPASRTYSVQIQHAKRRAWINLHTANKEQAAILARNLYLDIRANGWDAALAHRKSAPAEKKVNVTIGEYMDAVYSKSLIHPKTLESYAAALRKIASDIHGLGDGKRSTWRARVDSLKLATLSPEAIEAWRAGFIKRGSTNPLAEKLGEQLYWTGPFSLRRGGRLPRQRCRRNSESRAIRWREGPARSRDPLSLRLQRGDTPRKCA
jgi:hypothetical protein